MKNILPLLSILILISCKKEINTDLTFEGEKYFYKIVSLANHSGINYHIKAIKVYHFKSSTSSNPPPPLES